MIQNTPWSSSQTVPSMTGRMYGPPKSGWSNRDGPPMFASHVVLIGCTGRFWTLECHTLVSG